MPVSFDYGLYQTLMAARVGATLILEKSFAFPQEILQKITSEGVTGFPIVPTMAALLLQMKDLKVARFPHLRYITNTGRRSRPLTLKDFRSCFRRRRYFRCTALLNANGRLGCP